MKKISIALLFVMLSAFLSVAFAALPRTVNYQGYLKNSDGTPVKGTVNLTFSLYNVAAGPGASLWTETHSGVAVTNGVYSVVLGNASPAPTPITLPFDQQYWLGIKVNTEAEMSPRQALTAGPYAFRAVVAESADNAGTFGGKTPAEFALSGHSHTGEQITTTVANAVNADTVDNKHAADFVDIASSQTIGGTKTFSGNVNLAANGLTVGTNQLVASGGKVGIGTASPAKSLQVGGDFRVQPLGQYVYVASGSNQAGSLTPRCACDVDIASADCPSRNFSETDLGRTCYDVWDNGYYDIEYGWISEYFSNIHNRGTAAPLLETGKFGGIGINTSAPFYDLDVNGTVRATKFIGTVSGGSSISTTGQIVSTVGTGTAPLSVSSTTVVQNLNADMVDGYHASAFAQQTTTYTKQEVDALIASLENRMKFAMRAWNAPERVETNAGAAYHPQVAINSSGNAMVVWEQSDGVRNNIWANRYVAGTGWGAAQLIETDNAGHAEYPQVAMDSSGNAIAVWHQYDGVRDNIWANRYVAGTGWGAAQLIETDNTGWASYPQIKMDSSGNAIAVWQQGDLSRNNIWANRYVAGSGWGTAQLIETNSFENAYTPQVAMDSSGTAIAVWHQNDATRNNIWANRYVPGSGWGTAQLIETDNTGTAGYPQVAMDSSGNAIAVWSLYDGTRLHVWANRYVPGTGWGTAQLIETDNTGGAGYPQVAMDGSGNAIAVWPLYDGVRNNIRANRYVAGTGWGTAQLIETNNNGDASSPQVAMDSSGNATVVWEQFDGPRLHIWANRYVAGTGWGTAQPLETDNVGAAYSPQVAMYGNGNAIAAWEQSDGTRPHIWADRLQ